MFQLQRLILYLCLTFFVGLPYVYGWKNFFKSETNLAGYHCNQEWKENGLNYNHSLFVTNNRNTITLDWAQIFPDACTSKVNESAVNHYKKQLDTLLLQDIEPVVLLYSGNLPTVFGTLGGWTNPIIIQYFANYAKQSFKIFGNRVKTWITFEEPRTVCDTFKGLLGDEFPSGMAEYLCAHNILRAHAEAYHIYDKEFRITQNGKISITLDLEWAEAANFSNPKSVLAAERKVHFTFGLYANPLLNFDYPPIVTSRVAKRSKMEGFARSRLPEFTYADKLKLSGSYDYLGIKQNGITFIAASANKQVSKPSIKADCGCKTKKIFYSDDDEKWTKKQACQRMINWLKTTYSDSTIVLMDTEVKGDENDLEKRKKIKHKEYMKTLLDGVLEMNELLKG
ncbi:lactase/phlorizin hydrolase-like [Zophobas morio]|uniref:lactase/phlorizin hydrolase-like n=1 Tax=Zophobas morio TaxID=2755281 RepID=UPI0030835819